MPITAWVCVIVAEESAIARAMPKSMTLTAPAGVSITLAGLMSRCTMPARWLYSSAPRTPDVIRSASCQSSGAEWLSRSRTVRPSTYSITMYGACICAPPASVTTSSPLS